MITVIINQFDNQLRQYKLLKAVEVTEEHLKSVLRLFAMGKRREVKEFYECKFEYQGTPAVIYTVSCELFEEAELIPAL